MRRRLNIRSLLALVLTLAIAAGAVHWLHGYQVQRTADALLVRGRQAERKEDFATAETYFGRYMALRPRDTDALAAYGLLLERRGKTTNDRLRALQVLERALARAPERDDLRRKVVGIMMAPEFRRYRDARNHLVELLKATPTDGELEAQLGRCLEAFASGEETDAQRASDSKTLYAEAAQSYQSSIGHAPERIDGYVRLATLLRGPLKDEVRADRIMNARGPGSDSQGLVAQNPRSAEAYLARARYRQKYAIDGASDDIATALKLAPAAADALLMAATGADRSDRPDEARRLLRFGIERHPTERRMYLALAAVDDRAGNFPAAAATLREGIKQIPNQETLQWALVDVLIRSGEWREASQIIETLRERRDLLKPAIDILAARVLIEQGKLAEGIRLLDAARASLPETPSIAEISLQADLLLAAGFERLGNPERQAAASRRALRIDPQSAPARLALAAALLAQNRINEAIGAYREAIPAANQARLLLARLLIGQALRAPEQQRHWDEILGLLADDQATGSNNVERDILRAQVMMAQGQNKSARDLLARVRDQHPDQVAPWAALASLALTEGETAEVLTIFNRATERLGDRTELRVSKIELLARRGAAFRPELEAMVRDLDKFTGDDRIVQEEALGKAFGRLGDRQIAERLLSGVLRGRPADLQAAMFLFDLALQADETPERAASLRDAVTRIRRIEGDDGASWRYAEALRLIDLVRHGSRAELVPARDLLQAVQKLRPGWGRASLLEAEVEDLNGDQEEALGAYLRAIQQGETQPAAVQRTVGLLIARGRTAEADRLVRRLTDEAAPAGPLARLAAEMALRQDHPQEALAFARQAVQPDSVSPNEHFWLGQLLWASGQAGEAVAELQRAIALDPALPEPHVTLVRCLATLKRPAEATAAIDVAAKALSADQAPTVLGRCYEAVGRLDQAREQYQAALSRQPDNNRAKLAFAEFLLRTNSAREAEPLLRPILEPASGASPRELILARRTLALCTSVLGPGRLGEAVALLETNLRCDGNSAEDQRIKAVLLQSRASYRREAIRTWEALAQRAPLASADRLALARLYLGTPDWFKARDILQALLVADPKNPDYLATLARALLDHDRGAEAAGPVGQLVATNPRAFITVDLQARLLQQQGDRPGGVKLLEDHARAVPTDTLAVASALERLGASEAAETIHRRLAARPDRPEGQPNLALFLGRQGRTREALDVCEQIRSKPHQGIPLSNVCLQILGTGRGDVASRQRAAAWLREDLARNPTDPAVLFDLANIEDMSGHYDQAEALLRRAVKQAPNLSGPLNNLAWLLAVRGGHDDEALDLINRAIGVEGPEPDLLDTRSLIYLAQTKADRAVADLEQATAAKSTALFRFHLAQAQHEAGNDQAAQASLRQARDAGLDEQAIHPAERPHFARLVAALARN